MTRTKRKYNKDPTIWVDYLTLEDHPEMKWKQVCFGNCPYCKDHKKDQHNKTEKKKMLKFENVSNTKEA